MRWTEGIGKTSVNRVSVIRRRTDGAGAASCSEPPAARARYADDPCHPEKTG
jgi:hypothetical protein